MPPRHMTHTETRSKKGNGPPLSYDETENPQKPPVVARQAKIRSQKAGLFRIAIFIEHHAD